MEQNSIVYSANKNGSIQGTRTNSPFRGRVRRMVFCRTKTVNYASSIPSHTNATNRICMPFDSANLFIIFYSRDTNSFVASTEKKKLNPFQFWVTQTERTGLQCPPPPWPFEPLWNPRDLNFSVTGPVNYVFFSFRGPPNRINNTSMPLNYSRRKKIIFFYF